MDNQIALSRHVGLSCDMHGVSCDGGSCLLSLEKISYGPMKVFLLIRTERDDFDRIYGIYSSREKVETALGYPCVVLADVVEVELDAMPTGDV